MTLGISPGRYLGDEPQTITRYHYDETGRVSHTIQTRAAEWDDGNRAAVDAWIDYKADLHSCGRPLSESLHVDGQPDPDYVVGQLTCVACLRSSEFVEKHHKDGLPAHAVLQVFTRADAKAIKKQQTEGR